MAMTMGAMGMMGMMNGMMPMMMGMAGNGIVVPALIGQILALKAAILVAPAIAAVAFLFGQGATIICAQVWWRVLQYNRQSKIRKLRRQRLRGHHGPPRPHSGRHLGAPGGPIGGRLRDFMSRLIHRRRPPPPPHPIWGPPVAIPEEWPPVAENEFINQYPPSNHVDISPDAEPAFSIQNPVTYPESDALNKDEYDKIMAWAKGAPLELNVTTNQTGLNGTSMVFPTLLGNLTIETTTMTPTAMPQKASNSSVIRLVYSTSNSTQMVPIKITRIKRRKDEFFDDSVLAKYRKNLDESFLGYIRKDIRNFFTIVTNLDENKCIQKLVCDIHSRVAQTTNRSGRGSKSKFSSYEVHVLNAFKFLDIFFEKPSEIQDSTTKYRKAAQIGKSLAYSKKSLDETCQTYYKACGYSANDIMSFGNKLMNEESLLSSMFPSTTATKITKRVSRKAGQTSTADDKTRSKAYQALFTQILKYLF